MKILRNVLIAMICMTMVACNKDKDKEEEKSPVQLLESIWKDGKKMCEFGYDDQNRITMFTNYNEVGGIESKGTVNYNNVGELISIIYTARTKNVFDTIYPIKQKGIYDIFFEKSGNKIICNSNWQDWYQDDWYIEVNTQGLPLKEVYSWGEINYLYDQNGNLLSCTIHGDTSTYSSYDDKKTPFYNCKTPKWAWKFLFMTFRVSGGDGKSPSIYFNIGFRNNILKQSGIIIGALGYTYIYDDAGYPTACFFDVNANTMVVFHYIKP